MRECVNFSVRALALCAALFVVSAPGRALAQSQGSSGRQQAPAGGYQPSDAEMKAGQAVQQAADAQAALTAATAYVKKYAKSPGRVRVGRTLADKIAAVPDAAQRATLAESAAKLFDRPEEAVVFDPVLVGAYLDAKRLDDAYRVATPAAVVKFDDPLATMITLTARGADEAQHKNGKYVEPSRQLGLKAIEIIESGAKPAQVDDARWAEYKTKWLPQLYQSLAILSLASGNESDAKSMLDKAVALHSTDANTYILVGALANNNYQQFAQQYQSASGAAKDDLLNKAHAQLDQVIDAWAHAIALTEGDSRFDQTRPQLMQDLESYYKYRHGSAEGLQQLIDKYKTANAKP